MRKVVSRTTAGFFSGFTVTSKRTTINKPLSQFVDAKTAINPSKFIMPSSALSDVSTDQGFFQPSINEHESLSYIDSKSAVYITPDLKNMNVLCRRQDGVDKFVRAVSQLPGLSIKYSAPKTTEDYAKIEISGLYDVCQAITDLAAQIKAQDPCVSQNPSLLERRDYYINPNNYPSDLIPLYQTYNILQDRAFGVGHTTPLCLEFFLTNVGVNSERYRSLISDVAYRAREIRSEQPDVAAQKLPRRSL